MKSKLRYSNFNRRAMAEQESEQKRVARVRELEEMVKILESENRQLLNKVRDENS